MRGQADSSEVVVLHLAQLIDRIGDGRLHIPRFQRPLVWDWDKKRELLRSVRDGIPMGSVMIWRTNDERVSVAPSLAGHELPSPQPNLPREYILDGLQRLSTLYVALRGPGRANADADAEDDNGADVGYDLQEQDFIEIDDEPQQGVLPLDVLGSTVALLKAQRRWSGSEAETWVERSDDLARAFREYQIPVVTIVSNDLELATRTFKMVNSQGQPMDEADMVHALVWGQGIEIRDRLQALRDELLGPLGWGELDDETVLRVVKADANIDLYDRSAEAVSQRIREDPTRLDSAVRRLADPDRRRDRRGRRCQGGGTTPWRLVLVDHARRDVCGIERLQNRHGLVRPADHHEGPTRSVVGSQGSPAAGAPARGLLV
ncbi:MAG: DUF262 domain-containing protein [Nannocystaceae bacterium]